MKALQIIETAYRGTLEEQDDTIIWLSHSMRDAGAELSVLLIGNAVNYTLNGQDASGLRFGGWSQTNAPRIAEDIEKLLNKGVDIYVVGEDLGRRGLSDVPKLAGIKIIGRDRIADLLECHDYVWHW